MQQMLMLLVAVGAACVAAQPALIPTQVAPFAAASIPATAPAAAFTNFPAVAAAAPSPLPLAISSSQRLDYFNQFNAAFAPPARFVAAPAPVTAFPAFFGFPAANRFGQPARFIAATPASAPFIF